MCSFSVQNYNIKSQYLIQANKKHCWISQSPVQQQNARAESELVNIKLKSN